MVGVDDQTIKITHTVSMELLQKMAKTMYFTAHSSLALTIHA